MPSLKLDLLLTCVLCVPGIMTKYTPYLNPGFSFDYNKPEETHPIPVTEQCDRVHITWSQSTAGGVALTPPFYAQVFASTSLAPLLIPVGNGPAFDWDVPFAPGTQYQICMYDRHGVSGGCQAIYTVIQNSTALHPKCQNVTVPAGLGVLVTKPDGPRSKYGFIEQCTDMIITPTSGRPPFMLTIAPSLHPPFNISSNIMSPIAWTVSLSQGSPFFVALSSSDGQMWSMGPMHAGGPGRSDCLAPESISRKNVTNIILIVGICSAVGGVSLGLLCIYLAERYRCRRVPTSVDLDKVTSPDDIDPEVNHSLPLSPFLPPQYAHLSHELALSSVSRPQSLTIEPFTTSPSPGYVTAGIKNRMEGHWREFPFATKNSSRTTLRSSLHVATPPWTPMTCNDAKPLPSAPLYSITPDSENNVELPPEYVVDPAWNAS